MGLLLVFLYVFFGWFLLFIISGVYLEATEGGEVHPYWMRPLAALASLVVLFTIGLGFLILEHSHEETDQVLGEWWAFFTDDLRQILVKGYW